MVVHTVSETPITHTSTSIHAATYSHLYRHSNLYQRSHRYQNSHLYQHSHLGSVMLEQLDQRVNATFVTDQPANFTCVVGLIHRKGEAHDHRSDRFRIAYDRSGWADERRGGREWAMG